MKLLLSLFLCLMPFLIFAQAEEPVIKKKNTLALNLMTGDPYRIRYPFFVSEVQYSRYVTPSFTWRLALSYRSYTGKETMWGVSDKDLKDWGLKAGVLYDFKLRVIQFYAGEDFFYAHGALSYKSTGIAGTERYDFIEQAFGTNFFVGIKKVVFNRMVIGLESSLYFATTVKVYKSPPFPQENRFEFGPGLLSNFYVGFVF